MTAGSGAQQVPAAKRTQRRSSPKATRPHLRELPPTYPPEVVRYLYAVRDCTDATFNEAFVPSLERLTDNDSRMFRAAALLSIDGETGALVAARITRSSGDEFFDAGYLASLRAAFPMTPPPSELRSNDGRAYVRLELTYHPKKPRSEYVARVYKFEVAFVTPEVHTTAPRQNPQSSSVPSNGGCGYGSTPIALTIDSLSQYPAAPPETSPQRRVQGVLGDRRVAFAAYLNAIHNCLHPVFADRFVESLVRLPDHDPLYSIASPIAARVRLSIDGQTGNLVSLQLTHSSGDARFDTGAVASVRSAFPISPAPARELWSSDGGVHVDWELHRDPNNACSTYFARPYLFVDNER